MKKLFCLCVCLILFSNTCFSDVIDIVKGVCIEKYYVNGNKKGSVFNRTEISYDYNINVCLVSVNYVEYDNFEENVYRIVMKKVGKTFRRSDYANDKIMRDDEYLYELDANGMLWKKTKLFKDSDGIPNRIITEYTYDDEERLSYVLEYQEYKDVDSFCEYEDSYTIGFKYIEGCMFFGNGVNHNSMNDVTSSFKREPVIEEWKIEYSPYRNTTNVNYYTFIDEFCPSISSSSFDIEFATSLVNAREEYLPEVIYDTKYKTRWFEIEYEFDENDKLNGFDVYMCSEVNLLDRKHFCKVILNY